MMLSFLKFSLLTRKNLIFLSFSVFSSQTLIAPSSDRVCVCLVKKQNKFNLKASLSSFRGNIHRFYPPLYRPPNNLIRNWKKLLFLRLFSLRNLPAPRANKNCSILRRRAILFVLFAGFSRSELDVYTFSTARNALRTRKLQRNELLL